MWDVCVCGVWGVEFVWCVCDILHLVVPPYAWAWRAQCLAGKLVVKADIRYTNKEIAVGTTFDLVTHDDGGTI